MAGNGLHHSIGGKITSAREDAACIVDVVSAALNIDAACSTGHRDSPWKPEQNFPTWLEENGARARHLGIDAESANWLLRRHGRRAEQVFRLVEEKPELAGRIVPDLPFILADLLFCARDEMAVHLSDLLRRRLPLLILAHLGESDLRRLAELVAPALGWDAAAINREIEACRGAIYRAHFSGA